MQENLFKHIRNENVVLWVGAGFSLYTGYPSGQKLAEIFYNDLSDSEKNEVLPNQMLTNLVQDIYRLRGGNKNSIITTLNQVFANNVNEAIYHEKLATIPHFKTIITTNYDKLFEEAYGNNCYVLYNNKHVPYIDDSKTSIFKIHGDLSDPDSIILTTDDYNRFFANNSESSVLWTLVRERVSTKVVLFLGYNLEDPNISVLFDKIYNELGDNRKECYFIAPKVKKLKQDDLIRKGIQYIDSTGEEFIDKLIDNLKKNVVSDMESGKLSSETFRKFLVNYSILPDLTASENSFRLSGLKGLDKDLEGHIKFKLEKNEGLLKDINDITQGHKFGKIEINREQILEYNYQLGGINIPNNDLLKFTVVSVPKFDTIITIRFDNGFEIENIPVKVYGSSHKIEFHLDFKCADIKVTLSTDAFREDGTMAKIDILHTETYSNVGEGLNLFEFLINFSRGEEFTIFRESGSPIRENIKHSIKVPDSEFYFEYFKLLKLLEIRFRKKFSAINFDTITIKNYEILKSVLDASNGVEGSLDKENNGIKITFKKPFNHDEGHNIESNIIIKINKSELVDVYGHELDLGGKKIEVYKPYVYSKTVISNEEVQVEIRSREDKIVLTYEQIDDLEIGQIN